MSNKSAWGQEFKLKGTYKNEYEGEVKKISMDKEEFKKYMEELELKNRYKTRGIR